MNRSLPSRHLHHFAATLFCAFVTLALLAPAAQAGGQPGKGKERGYKQKYDQIVSVDPAAHTVTVATMVKEVSFGNQTDQAKAKPDQQEKVATYKVTSISEIEVNGKKSDLSALSQGMKVSVTKGMDEHVLGRLAVQP